MAEVISTLTQLVNAFKRHSKFSETKQQENSHLLLLFYAVECGLKAKYLKDNKSLTTKDFINLPIAKKHGHGHDLWEWIKVLKLPKFAYHDDKNNRPIVQMHERLRYGAFSKADVEKEQIKFLKEIAHHLKNEI